MFDTLIVKDKDIASKMSVTVPEFAYGTAGFRCSSEYLDVVTFRVGVLASIRSLFLGKIVGVMVTASHNPVNDNGVKIIDPSGEMLEGSWEPIAAELVNVSNDELSHHLEMLAKKFGVFEKMENGASSNVFTGMDTRPHSPRLLELVEEGVKVVGGEVRHCGHCTTPQLHFYVQQTNLTGIISTEKSYFERIGECFAGVVKNSVSSATIPLVIDGANGIGGWKASSLAKPLSDFFTLRVMNAGISDDEQKYLNDGVGAEFVQKERKFPRGMDPDIIGDALCASFDGDADRIVFFKNNPRSNDLLLLDGDKIACLFALHVKDSLRKSLGDESTSISIGVVQTAYANGASTSFLNALGGIRVLCVPTGVKHLHHAAKTEVDVGIYFEANGHGTALFSEKCVSLLEKNVDVNSDAKSFLSFVRLFNSATGDAISDCLAVLGVLVGRNMSVADWNALYEDFPTRQMKVKVEDRSKYKTTYDEQRIVSIPHLQDEIDELVGKYPSSRAFIRPSGTEDVVRVFAEASTQVDADHLAQEVAEAVTKC